MSFKVSCFTVLILALFSTVFAQNSQFSGTVADSAGRPIAGATVIIRNTLDRSERTTTSNAEGIFSLEAPGTGPFEIIVSAKSFGTITREAIAGESGITITLDPQPITDQVTVTATRTQILASDATMPVSVIDRLEIERKAINTVGDIFRTLPGTSTVNEGAFQVRPRIRGLDSNRVLILVDGERLNNSRTATGQSGIEPGLIDISQIETVEVVRGSGSVLYGTDALAGTINIITRDTPPRRSSGFRLGAVLDTFYTSNENGRRGNLAVNGSSKFFAFRIAQSLERFDNYFTGDPTPAFLTGLRDQGFAISDDGEALNSQSHGSNSSATLRFFLNDTSTIRANYDRRRAANVGSAGLIGAFSGSFPFSNRDKVSARYDVAGLTDAFERLSVSAFYQTQYRNFTNVLTVPGFYQLSETVTDTKTSGVDVQTDWNLGSRNDLTAGISYFRDDNTDRRLTLTGTSPTSPGLRFNNSRSVPDASLSSIAAFAQDDFRVTDRLRLVGGIRVDKFQTVSDPTTGFTIPNLRPDQIEDLGINGLDTGLNVSNTSVTGDFGAIYRLTRNVNIAARLGRSFRVPNIFELFFTGSGSVGGFVVGNPFLKPESGVNLDTSLRIKTSKFAASATYFTNSYTNFLATAEAFDSRGCPVFIVRPGTVYDSNNCNIVSSPPGPAPVRVYQTQNIDRARIQGFEAEFEMPFKISVGYLTPNGNFSYLRGDNTAADQPLNFISPFRTNVGVRWQNFGKAYFFDYTVRIVGEQSRLSNSFLNTPVNQGGNGGPEPGFVTHNMGGGYYLRRERFNFNVNLGVSNLFDKAYSEQFVFAPARGRSLTIGTTIEIK